ncbi:polysaccharide deacetylase family protein [Streptomyces sp. NPDC049813]|uniref:polysaccharide deacetylase family protein n=1 Tax=Streptomyces sp. NPDC049813 TaxID=3365597 RepID=UPI0037B71416
MAACVVAVALLAGCAPSVDPLARMGRKAAQKVRHAHPGGGAAGQVAARGAAPAPGAPAAPRAAPAHHVFPSRPRTALPPVVDRVPTRDRVVFLAVDDGAGADPRFARLVRELRLPVSVFLTRSVAGPGRDHLGELRALGAGMQNRTLTGPLLPGLGYVAQHAQICGQQDHLKGRFGAAPRLLSPPYGAYDADTLRAAGACGIDAIVLTRAHGDGDPLRPGDIVRVPATPSLTRTTTALLHRIRARGLMVARLESYL